MSEVLSEFRAIASDPTAYARNWKEKTGRRVIGYFCTYVPDEIIHAAGALPFRIFGDGGAISLADRHLQTYCCSLARGGLEMALAGKLSFLDGTVFPHTCDTIQRLSDVWRLNAGFPLHLDIVLPVKLDTASAREYMRAVIGAFRDGLARGLGPDVTDEKLRASVRLYNKTRAILRDIYRLRSENPGALSGSDMFALLKCFMVMDRGDFAEKAALVRDGLAAAEVKPSKKKRIVIAGGVCNQPDIYSLLEESGGVVVWDELCTGTRSVEGDLDESADPLDAITGRLLARPLCPAKHRGVTERGDGLAAIAREHRADGVIFLLLKFCDPHAFDYPFMKQRLDEAGVPSMLLELEEQPPPEGQLRTRFETFVEML